MAKKKESSVSIVLERTYNVPLRRGFINTPRHRKTKKAMLVLRSFLSKHMKTGDIKIGKYLNLELWKNGIKNPPHHVKVKATKDNEGKVFAELEGAPEEKKEKEEPKKKRKKETIQEKVQGAVQEVKEGFKKEDKPKEEKSEEKKEEVKEEKKKPEEEKKEEIKEEKPKPAKKESEKKEETKEKDEEPKEKVSKKEEKEVKDMLAGSD